MVKMERGRGVHAAGVRGDAARRGARERGPRGGGLGGGAVPARDGPAALAAQHVGPTPGTGELERGFRCCASEGTAQDVVAI